MDSKIWGGGGGGGGGSDIAHYSMPSRGVWGHAPQMFFNF